MRILYFSFVNLDRPNACQTHTLGILAGFSQQGLKVEAVVTRPKLRLPEWPGLTYHFTGSFRGGRRYLLREVLVSTALMVTFVLSLQVRGYLRPGYGRVCGATPLLPIFRHSPLS